MIEKSIVDSKTRLNLKLAPGGGTAISLIPVTQEQAEKFKKDARKPGDKKQKTKG